MQYKVTVVLNGSRSHPLRNALAFTRTSAILDSVVEVNIG